MFTQKCKIDQYNNTIDIDLKNLGYLDSSNILSNYSGSVILDSGIIYPESGYPGNKSSIIDCSMNYNIFLAIASIQDDTDKDQWFIYDNSDWANEIEKCIFWYKCRSEKIEDELYYDLMYNDCTKATPAQIYDRFSRLSNNKDLYFIEFTKDNYNDIIDELENIGYSSNFDGNWLLEDSRYIICKDGFWNLSKDKPTEGIDFGIDYNKFLTNLREGNE